MQSIQIIHYSISLLLRIAATVLIVLAPFTNAVLKSKDMAGQDYPFFTFPLSEKQIETHVQDARDWIWSHGVLVRRRDEPAETSHAPFVLFPSPFRRDEFEQAYRIQEDLNLLIHKVAHDYQFLKQSLQQIIKVDEFTKRLWNIYETIHTDGPQQEMSLGLLRSDYMMDACSNGSLKQVEINTIASGMGGLGTYVADYARHVLHKNGKDVEKYCPPKNDAVEGLAHGLLAAHQEYNQQFITTGSVILFVVMDPEWNLYDQRAMEYAVEQLSTNGYKHPSGSIPKSDKSTNIIRKTIPELYSAVLGKNKALIIDGMEVSVVYFRNMYSPNNFDSEKDWDLRLLIEQSRAIKSPSINYHLAGSKKVQQLLARPGVVEQFLTDKQSIRNIRNVFAGLYQLDQNTEGEKNVEMILEKPENFVLKPQREGGGNNVFAKDIPGVLQPMRFTEERTAWIAMDRLCSVVSKNYIVRPNQEVTMQEINSELGIFGAVLGDSNHILLNRRCGYLLRSKPSIMTEGGTATGIGALDSPLLVDDLDLEEGIDPCCKYSRPDISAADN